MQENTIDRETMRRALRSMAPDVIHQVIKDAQSELEERERAERAFSVWGKTDNLRWLERNGRCADVLIVYGVSKRQAELIADRLQVVGVQDPEVRKS
ncbi:hypothetical protein ACI2L4_25080 [Streptomyces sparsogenes]|uniref:hypothetical protein n=1 Tax=Streptomyces sparsogenes TaxID=67365 RepID=UPI00384D8150